MENESSTGSTGYSASLTGGVPSAPASSRVAPVASLLLLACIAILLADEIRYLNDTYDDAFIFFRYAENLARGKGWVFTSGEPVEAYTSFLWTALLGLAAWMGAAKTKIGLVIVAKAAGVLLSLGTVVGMSAAAPLVSPRARNPLPGSIAVLYLCLSAPFAMWAVGGLETPLAALLAVAAVYFYLRDRLLPTPTPTATWPRSAVLFALATLSRPEMAVLFAVTAAFDWVRPVWTHASRAHVLRNLTWCAAFLVPVGAHLLWRRAYYGQWLPNTYYAKVYGDGLTWDRGTMYISAALVDLGLGVVLAVAVVPFVFARRMSMQVAYLLALTLAYLLAIALEGGDWMPAFRFVMPILPLLALLFDAGVTEAYDRFHKVVGRWLVGTVALGLVGATSYLARRTIPRSHTPSGFQIWSPVPPAGSALTFRKGLCWPSARRVSFRTTPSCPCSIC